MALKRPPSAIEFMFRIKVQHYSGNFTPVSTLHVRVEQAQIRDEVLLVVHSQHGIGGRGIGDVWIKRPLLHGRSRNRLLIDQLCFGLWHIDDREAVAPHSHRSLPNLRAQMPGPLYLDEPPRIPPSRSTVTPLFPPSTPSSAFDPYEQNPFLIIAVGPSNEHQSLRAEID